MSLFVYAKWVTVVIRSQRRRICKTVYKVLPVILRTCALLPVVSGLGHVLGPSQSSACAVAFFYVHRNLLCKRTVLWALRTTAEVREESEKVRIKYRPETYIREAFSVQSGGRTDELNYA